MERGLDRSLEKRVRVSRSLPFMPGSSTLPKKNQNKSNRLLISVTVVGSAGPLRFLVNADELVMAVIEQTLKSYAHEGRLPVLGSDFNKFLLYCAHGGSDALSPNETIGSFGGRNFVLCKKRGIDLAAAEAAAKSTSGWKSWLNKSFHLKISSH
ncbi:uncharacterized protein At4g22758-like [Nymphaea colorata]|nr:uncharacterized protein At4g22758-like [Nymphaea colorata]